MWRWTSFGLLAALALPASQAFAEEPLEVESSAAEDSGDRRLRAGGLLGLNYVSDQVELGNAVADEQVPGSGLMIGGRAGYLLLPEILPGSPLAPRLWLELEAKLTTSSTGEAPMSGRDSHFAPIFGWRAHGLLSLWSDGEVSPFVVLGAGGETAFTNSPFFRINPDTDAAVYWGVGGRYDLGDRYGLRADLRHVLTAGRFSRVASQIEVNVGFEYRFDLPYLTRTETRVVVVEKEVPVATAPAEPADADGDGIADADDQCPDEPEDLDGFEDDDGCPDPDNDGDGIADADDQCPDKKEVYNGFEDDDGCPDIVPPELLEYTGVIEGITFRSGSASITRASHRTLDRAVEILDRHKTVRIRVSGHTDSTGKHETNVELSRKRADHVKWYLVDKGIDAERIETVGLGPDQPIADNDSRSGRAKNRRIEFELLPGERTVQVSDDDEGSAGGDDEGSVGGDAP